MRTTSLLRRLRAAHALGGALLSVALGNAPALVPSAAAQVTASPGAVEVSLPAGQAAEIALTVSNASMEPQPLALALAPADIPADGTEPGDVLFTSAPGVAPSNAVELAMTPDGRLFVAQSTIRNETAEFTADLTFVRDFEHPTTAFLSATVGLAYSPDTGSSGEGSLWWMDIQRDDGEIEQVLLLEGDFEGEPTGRELAFPFGDGGICGHTTGYPARLAYDRNAVGAGRFYYLDIRDDTIWAIDTLGVAACGYPVPFSDYAGRPQPPYNPEGCLINSGIDAHSLGGEPLLEAVLGYPYIHPRNRAYTVVVLDRRGRNRGAETPLFDLPTPDGYGEVLVLEDVTRSRLDPSVLYLTVITGFLGDGHFWVYAVRAAPLPPGWLRAEDILFSVEGESEAEVTLTLDASGLEPGEYEGVVAVRAGDGIGPVVAEVPVSLTVTEGTSTEGGAEETGASSLAVYPNPTASAATLGLTLAGPAEVRVALYDVLGREIAVLHDGPLAVGRAEFLLPPTLPGGVYVVRAVGEGLDLTRRFTSLR